MEGSDGNLVPTSVLENPNELVSFDEVAEIIKDYKRQT